MAAADEVECASIASQAAGIPLDIDKDRHSWRAFLKRLLRSRSGRFGLSWRSRSRCSRSSRRWRLLFRR